MAQATSNADLPATPAIVAGLIADGLEPVQETLKRMENLLNELAGQRQCTSQRREPPNFAAQHPIHLAPLRSHTDGGAHCPNSCGQDSSPGWQGPIKHAPSLRPWLHQSCLEPDPSTADHPPLHPSDEEQLQQSPAAAGGLETLCDPDASRQNADAPPAAKTLTRGSTAESRLQTRNLDIRSIARGGTSDDSHISNMTKRACWKLRQCYVRASMQKEPERSGCLNNLVTSMRFENMSAAVILMNSIFVAYTSDFEMKYPGKSHHIVVEIMEIFFVSFYTIELLLRLANHRFYFFSNTDFKWNVFDFVLVSMSLFDMLMTAVGPGDGNGGNVSFMRIFRLLKLAKILRTLRVMKVFRDLSQILESFKNCMTSLLWSLVMMIFVLYVFSLIFIQGLTGFISESGDTDVNDEIRDMFGSMGGSMLSLYMAVTGGMDWAESYYVVSKAGHMYSVLYIFFMFFFAFALFNILTGVFVEKAVVSAQPEREEVILEQRKKRIEEVSEFRHICKLLDTDATGTISRSEFYESMQNELMVSYMNAVGLEIGDVELFFDIAAGASAGSTDDPEEMKVGIDEFVDCCMSMRGMASSFDVQRQRFELQAMGRSVKDFEAKSLHQMEQITSDLKRLQGLVGAVRAVHAGGSSQVSTPRVSAGT